MGLVGDVLDILLDDEEFNPDFTIRNKMGYDIHEVYVSESDDDDWGDDCLDEDTIIEDGERCEISFETNSRHRWWDLRIVDEEGDEVIFEHFDLSQVRVITLYYDDDGEAVADYQ